MSLDPRDLDERQLLMAILEELQTIRQALTEDPVAVVTEQPAAADKAPPEPAKLWRVIVYGDPAAWFRQHDEVDRIVETMTDMRSGGTLVTYVGRGLPDAVEA